MEFVEAVNPHYAVPIVGVIVCALLVFAFGFKSPGQPPSFDIVDDERKAPKRRKGKENQKNKLQQNGRVPSNATVKVDSMVPVAKVKASAEKLSLKAESKPNKKSRKEQNSKLTEPGNKKETPVHEDSNEAGWVQLLSKKERKNRKKDDSTALDVEVIKSSVSKTLDIDVMDNSTENGDQNGAHPNVKERKVSDANDVVVENRTDEDFKLPSKSQRTPKKKKGKKEETEKNVETDVTKQVFSTPADLKETISTKETKLYAPLVENVPVAEPVCDELLQIERNVDAEDESKNKSKKKKGKKKNLENISDTISITAPPTEKEKKVSETMTKKDIIVETKHVSQDLNGEMNDNQTKEVVTTKSSSNVAFDELGDISDEKEKPQKKKKKVRREH